MMRYYQIALNIISTQHRLVHACYHYFFPSKPSLIPVRLLDIDDFIENLWKIHVQVKSEGYVQVQIPSITSIDAKS
jgi:hypothetical protein